MAIALKVPQSWWMSRLVERIQTRLEATGFSTDYVSLSAGMNRSALRQILNGRVKSPRIDNVAAIARVLGTTVQYLLGETDDPAAAPMALPQLRMLPVLHVAQAGTWREVEDRQEPLGEAPLTLRTQWPESAQWGELVAGDSMDLVLPPGSIAHVVDAAVAGADPRDGDVVVVERVRASGLLRERSIKEVLWHGRGPTRRISLIPRSRNEKWKPLDLADDPDATIRIVGIVIGSFRPLPGWGIELKDGA